MTSCSASNKSARKRREKGPGVCFGLSPSAEAALGDNTFFFFPQLCKTTNRGNFPLFPDLPNGRAPPAAPPSIRSRKSRQTSGAVFRLETGWNQMVPLLDVQLVDDFFYHNQDFGYLGRTEIQMTICQGSTLPPHGHISRVNFMRSQFFLND